MKAAYEGCPAGLICFTRRTCWPSAPPLQALLVDSRYRKARWRKAHAHAGMEEWNNALLNMQVSGQQCCAGH